MAGRGGRGSALLKALEEPTRRPGAAATDTPQLVQHASMPPKVPGGRGSYLLQMLEQTTSSAPLAQPVHTTPHLHPASINSVTLQPNLQSTTSVTANVQQPPTKSAGGRGQALLKLCVPSTERPVRQVKPLSPPQSDTTLASPTQQLAHMSISQPVRRQYGQGDVDQPKNTRAKGTTGTNVRMSANYIRLRSSSSHWYQYSVTYSPNIDSMGLRYKLLYAHEDQLGDARVFDGSVLFLPKELNSKVMTFLSINPYSDNQQQITIKVTLIKTISNTSRCCLQLYNTLFKRIFNILNMVQIGRSASYDQSAAISIPAHKLQVWPGYVTSVEEYEGGLLLMCDVSHKVLREETAYELMKSVYTNPRIPPEEKKDRILKALIGQSVITRYNNKTYRIDDIDFGQNPLATFERREGLITFADYYKNQYGIVIHDLQQPMLISRTKQTDRRSGEKREQLNALIPELAFLTGLTDEMVANHRMMKDIAVHTRVTPQNRVLALKKFIDNVTKNKEANSQLSKWGLSLETATIQLQGRQLPPENIIMGGKNNIRSAGLKADFTQFATNNPVVLGVDLRNWLIVFSQRDQNTALTYTQMYIKIGAQLGIQVAHPQDIGLREDSTQSYIKNIRDHVNESVQLVVVIFPTKREDKYNAVKKLLCAEKPCPSQMIIARTLQGNKLNSVIQKVALQINAKLGGELWRLSIPLNNVMYIGIDVYHDGGKGKGKSVAGLVASLNSFGTRYYSQVAFQSPGDELISALKLCFIGALKKYFSINNTLPAKIIVFRDGVGDSMMEMVADHEVSQLRSCFDTFEQYVDSPPGLVVIVVKKRISARLFAVKNRMMENPGPGTVIDHTITKARWYDFFLVSQHVTQGTVTPTHYVVVHDSTTLSADHLQQLTYKLCHLYYNWSGTVRVPAPCQYAHKLAYLIGENVKRAPAPEMADKLYFL